MELRQLSAIVGIADNGSFSAAADALQTVQSNISAHVKKLERELGCELVDRSTGQLTEAGTLVVARSRRVQVELEALLSDVIALTHEVAGTVRVGIIGTTARWLVPQLFRTAPQRYPHLRLVFVELTTTRLDSQLATGEVDLAVLNLPAKGADLALTPLFEEDVVLVVPAEHPLASSPEVRLSALKGIPLLLPATGTAFRADLDAALNSTGTTLLARSEIEGTRLIASLTFEGWGPSILPATAVPSYLRDKFALVRIPEIPRRLIAVVQRATGLPSAPVRAVLDLLTEIAFDPSRLPEGLTAVPPDSPRRPRTAETRRSGIVPL
ncbi:MAG: LysR substrate-binding domain-containing protein [Acidimicrobiales bacterium]|jgi:LysR family hydrogen peroxide-inducible transcriptional activator